MVSWDAVITFVSDEANREMISWVAGGAAVVVASAWSAFRYFHRAASTPAPSTSVTAEGQGVAAGEIAAQGGSVVGARDVTQGVPADQLPAILDANARGWARLDETRRAEIADLKERLGVSEGAVAAFLQELGERHVPPEKWQERLVAIAEDYKRALAEAAPAEGDAPAVAELKAKARDALEAGELERADEILAEVQAAEDADIDRRRLEAAATRAQRGDLALARLRYRDAARHFAAAAERVPAGEEETALDYLNREAEALCRQGEEFGDNAALADAIARYRALIERRPRERVPVDWAITQLTLGLALLALGERETGTARLKEAVNTCRAALTIFDLQRMPFEWAFAQSTLGAALLRLGERQSSVAWYEKAVQAFRAALPEVKIERNPLGWAEAQNLLGAALVRLGEREIGTTRLNEAVHAFRAALTEYTRERVPLHWAITQNNFGSALCALGERESGTARLEEAVDTFRAALNECTRERAPLRWAMTQSNLGHVLRVLGERERSTDRLEEAVDACRAALTERTRERVPLEWAATQNNLGAALRALGERESGSDRLEEAVDACRAALGEYTRDRIPLDWAMTHTNLANALKALGERESGAERLEEAVDAYRAALEVFEAAGADHYVQVARDDLARAEALLAERRGE